MHSIDELLHAVHRHYPAGLQSTDPSYSASEEYRRLVAARRRAGSNDEPWRGLLRRMSERFPDREVQDRAIHLATGALDACYSASLHLPIERPGDHTHTLGILVSILVPSYVVYSARLVDDPERTTAALAAPSDDAVHLAVGDTMFVLPAAAVSPALRTEAAEEERLRREDLRRRPYRRQEIHFDLAPEEQTYATWIAVEIEAAFGHERMPPEVGRVLVPDVAAGLRLLGEATIYDCLFSDQW